MEPAVFCKIERIKGTDWQMKGRPSPPVRTRFDGMRFSSEVTQVLEDSDRRGHKGPIKKIVS